MVKKTLEKMLGGLTKGKEEEEIDVEEYLNELALHEGEVEDESMTYVKPMDLDDKAISAVITELNRGNIIMLNVKPLMHNKVKLKEIITELSDTCRDIDGDLGRVSEEKVLIVPPGMRIVHRES